jgi:hypothetical protein
MARVCSFDFSSLPKIIELENGSDTIVVSRLEHFGNVLCLCINELVI